MRNDTASGLDTLLAPAPDARAGGDRWEPPTVEVICLACEISAYAPDGDLPLF